MRTDEHPEVVAEKTGSDDSPITVAVSLYNYREYIISCLESVKGQSLDALDLVVVDDCSTDGGGDLVSRWMTANGTRFNRLTLLRHKRNQGLSAARNSAFAHARTEHVFVLDADNLLYPRCLQRLLVGLSNCAASFAYCYLEKFGQTTGLHNIRPWNPSSLRYGNTIDAMVLLRRSVWEAVGGYSTDMPATGWEDFDLWFKIARTSGWGVQIPEILARYSVHGDSMLGAMTNANVEKLWPYLRSNYPEFFPQGAHAIDISSSA